ncbi:MAG TPA: 50S ribosomal protein L6 [Candidatus Paceibacterota bacterium]|jgi:large subunit ribosomal protein L6
MSRLGKRELKIPEHTEVTVSDTAVHVKGPKGELTKVLHPLIRVEVKDNAVKIEPKAQSKLARALWGTYASLLKSMMQGVREPFSKKLIIEGVGYRAALSGNTLDLSVGFSHAVKMEIPEGLSVTVEKNEITIVGASKELVGQFAAEVRAKKKPEPYKGKGIRYSDEVVRRKQGKRAVASS